MRIRSITLFLALGTAGTVACGSGGGPEHAPGGAPLRNGTYQTPPSTYDAPSLPNPTDYDRPETDYETPPDQSEAGGTVNGGSIAGVCTRLCEQVLSLNCPGFSSGTGAAQLDCSGGCAKADIDVPCPGHAATAIGCLFDQLTLTCDTFTEEGIDGLFEALFADNQVESCRGPFEEFARCAAADNDQEPPPPGECEPNACRGCVTDCAQCLCDNDDDIEYCTDICIAQ